MEEEGQKPQPHTIGLWVSVALIVIVGLALAGFGVYQIINQQPANKQQPVGQSDMMLQNNDTTDLFPAFGSDDATSASAGETTPTPGPIIVYISGAVQHPDVYELPFDARVKDVVNAAGGFTDEADHESINLADYIEDAQHIHVPRHAETTQTDSSSAQTPPYDDAPTAPNVEDTSSNLININTARATELEELKGIGEVTAQRIIDYRTLNGPFDAIEDLQEIRGISPSLLDKIKDQITVGK